jgi:hypothetical protein
MAYVALKRMDRRVVHADEGPRDFTSRDQLPVLDFTKIYTQLSRPVGPINLGERACMRVAVTCRASAPARVACMAPLGLFARSLAS